MRNAFADEVLELANEDDKLVLLTADIGNRLFDNFKERHGDRFFNCGIAEANMTGVAAGMALCGLRPITYTIAAFSTIRCIEQIRVDLCYHDLPATIIGVGGGLSYSPLGYTHHANEDIAMMRSLPNMVVLSPIDQWELRGALRVAQNHDGPVYIRIGKKGEPQIHNSVPDMKIGGSSKIRDGDDICILVAGTIMPNALLAADLLKAQDVSCAVISCYSIKPLDENNLREIFDSSSLVVTLEEHSVVGGLGTAVADWMIKNIEDTKRFLRLGLPDEVIHRVGSQSFLQEKVKLDGASVAKRIFEHFKSLDIL